MSKNLNSVFPIFAAAAATLLMSGFAHASSIAKPMESRPLLIKAAVCKPVLDPADPLASDMLRFNLFAQYHDFSKSGQGMAMVKMRSPHIASMTIEIGVPVDFEVKNGIVTLNIPSMADDGDVQDVQPITFSAAALMATMDPKVAPVKITVPSDHGPLDLLCVAPIKYPTALEMAEDKQDESEEPKTVVVAATEAAPAPIPAAIPVPAAK